MFHFNSLLKIFRYIYEKSVIPSWGANRLQHFTKFFRFYQSLFELAFYWGVVYWFMPSGHNLMAFF
jgi:hypothetical protein